MGRSIPCEILTGCPELDRVWGEYAEGVVGGPGIVIPDTDEDLTWHAFLGHSIDMRGFRAAEFAGVDKLSRAAPKFRSLRERALGVPELAALWQIEPIQRHLRHGTKGAPLRATLDVLRRCGGTDGESLADAFHSFPWRKGHWAVRALLQNSAALKGHEYSFRNWLQHQCAELGAERFPPSDFRAPVEVGSAGTHTTLEEGLRKRVEAAFYMVGPALSAYMICDWQLWLWNEGMTDVFAMYKQDAFHDEFVTRYGKGVIPADREGFTRWWFSLQPELPPRLANECIWLGMEHGIERALSSSAVAERRGSRWPGAPANWPTKGDYLDREGFCKFRLVAPDFFHHRFSVFSSHKEVDCFLEKRAHDRINSHAHTVDPVQGGKPDG